MYWISFSRVWRCGELYFTFCTRLTFVANTTGSVSSPVRKTCRMNGSDPRATSPIDRLSVGTVLQQITYIEKTMGLGRLGFIFKSNMRITKPYIINI